MTNQDKIRAQRFLLAPLVLRVATPGAVFCFLAGGPLLAEAGDFPRFLFAACACIAAETAKFAAMILSGGAAIVVRAVPTGVVFFGLTLPVLPVLVVRTTLSMLLLLLLVVLAMGAFTLAVNAMFPLGVKEMLLSRMLTLFALPCFTTPLTGGVSSVDSKAITVDPFTIHNSKDRSRYIKTVQDRGRYHIIRQIKTNQDI